MKGEHVLVERRDATAVVTLNRGVTNALNPDLVAELGDAIREAVEEPGVDSLVLDSASDRFFSIGWDIPQLLPLDPTAFRSFYRAFQRTSMALFTSPKPTVAAITGHATAGGCILALLCDRRAIASGHRLLGLNEVKLGVTVPYEADCILHDLVGSRVARRVMEAGEFHAPDASLGMGLVDVVLPLPEVRSHAVEVARSLAATPHGAYAAIKRNRVERVRAQIALHAEEREREFIDLWYSPAARTLLQEAAARF